VGKGFGVFFWGVLGTGGRKLGGRGRVYFYERFLLVGVYVTVLIVKRKVGRKNLS